MRPQQRVRQCKSAYGPLSYGLCMLKSDPPSIRSRRHFLFRVNFSRPQSWTTASPYGSPPAHADSSFSPTRIWSVPRPNWRLSNWIPPFLMISIRTRWSPNFERFSTGCIWPYKRQQLCIHSERSFLEVRHHICIYITLFLPPSSARRIHKELSQPCLRFASRWGEENHGRALRYSVRVQERADRGGLRHWIPNGAIRTSSSQRYNNLLNLNFYLYSY